MDGQSEQALSSPFGCLLGVAGNEIVDEEEDEDGQRVLVSPFADQEEDSSEDDDSSGDAKL